MMQKQILYKLMELGNKEADKYLAQFANEIKGKVLLSKKNDLIYQNLELLEEFVYKAPKQTVDIFRRILKTNYPLSKSRSKFGWIEGKTRTDIVLKGLDLLSEIRYISPKTVLPLLEKVYATEENPAKEKALEIVKKFSKYDYTVLKSPIGYRAQKTILDYISKWSMKKRITQADFVLTVIEEVLNSSVEGSSWSDEKTLTMNFSQVQPTPFLKTMRRDAMDLVFGLYKATIDAKLRLRLSSVLEEVMRGPNNVEHSPELVAMLDEDARYLAEIYRRMVFDASGNLIRENIAVAEEIEERLFYFAKPENGKPLELFKLRDDILHDQFYERVSPILSRDVEQLGTVEYEEKRTEKIHKLVASISERNIEEWKVILDILARQREVIDEWKLGYFKKFLEELALSQPNIAHSLLECAFQEQTALMNFACSFLMGFRDAQRFDLWDASVEYITKTKDPYLVGGICWSLGVYKKDQVPEKLRETELAFLQDIVFKRGRFAFIGKSKKTNGMWHLHDRLFHALAFHFSSQPQEMERLLQKEMEDNSEYSQVYYQGLQFVTMGEKRIDLSLISESFKKFLTQSLIEAPDLDWHLQEVLIELCEKNAVAILDVLKKRIDRVVQLKKQDKSCGMRRLMKRKEFDAIPFHFNSDLQELLKEDKNFSQVMQQWMQEMTLEWSQYNWEISRFLDGVHADRNKVFSEIVKTGDDDTLLRVAYAMEATSNADLELCMNIIGRTDSKRIRSKIGATLYTTGVVSGEYGIADAYKRKAESLEEYTHSKNKRIQKFAKETIESLRKSEEQERQRVAEDIQLRKIQFEG